MENLKRNTKGITLIALVITVIVMLILAAVAINMTIGDNGIFKRTSETVIIHENASVYEQLCLKIVDDELGDRLDNTQTDKLSKLKSDGYVNEDNSVNANIVTKTSMKTGKGSIDTGNDVYVIELTKTETGDAQYYLLYYNEVKEAKNLGKLFEVSAEDLLTPTSEDYFIFEPETGKIALKDSLGFYCAYMNGDSTAPQIGLKTIVIPEEYEGQKVIEIGGLENRGVNASDVEKIVIPKSVTKIGELAFGGCTNLKTIVIPNGVTEIGNKAFADCRSLTEIVIPETVTKIGEYTFSLCNKLRSASIPKTVSTIGERAFYRCNSLEEVVVPKSITKLEYGTFAGCSALRKVVLSEGIVTIGISAFSDCSSLQEIVIPNSVTIIEDSAFRACKNIQEIIIPASVVTVTTDRPSGAFTGTGPFSFWTSEQKIQVPFKQGEKPEGWDSYWAVNCKAQIIYQP